MISDKEIEELYKKAAALDTPDLWERVEAGFDKETEEQKKKRAMKKKYIPWLVAAAVLAVMLPTGIIAVSLFGGSNDASKELETITNDNDASADFGAYMDGADYSGNAGISADTDSSDWAESIDVQENDVAAEQENEVITAETSVLTAICNIYRSREGTVTEYRAEIISIAGETNWNIRSGDIIYISNEKELMEAIKGSQWNGDLIENITLEFSAVEQKETGFFGTIK